MAFIRFLSSVFVAGVLASACAEPAAVGVYEKEIRKKSSALDSIKRAIDARRSKLRALEKDEGNYLARLDYLGKNIAASRQYLSLLSSRIAETENSIGRLSDSLRGTQEQLANRQAAMKLRLRRAYMTGSLPSLIVLLLAKDPLNAIHRAVYLAEVHRYDKELAGKIDRTRKTIGAKRTSREEERSKLAALLNEKQKENKMLLAEEASRRSLISDIRSKKKANLSVIAELQATQNELNAMIRLLEQKRKKAAVVVPGPRGPFDQQLGKLPWPLAGPVLARFGRIVHPEYKTVTMNNGIDIGAAPGQEVHSVAAGTIIHTGAMRGLGKLVIVDHGQDYLSIYAQLEKILTAPNQPVDAGTVIGAAGSSGMHFEIRKSSDAVDPLLWLGKKQ
ncbi:MAG: peptidoglycan DD-metalloendopeptidase family protein [Chitinispirillaceae bacterium]|jgi:septal ring factor EnvC (AmiA/AmiB activator)|nr:peptidoglycan DD-metalloendopeptidase family protein [Chitinispirillaceae bacterium]